ncbi:hypothetical protein SAMN02745751_03451 [Dethiosulfatibacter aminovorans DSM 17477]|uniref:ABC-three component systems C-terminal domain-containing protein n=1 Tax=Dethiosulfatibacter aminovorans DSM 17477 TaxID=1121476 RepID=A0A1M6MED2_9FIRM|nr:ABC-three component system protein [Dethiosulfatibacter aminovorans]SHJ81872.1 hypothetical protein SAMN02745751_03451 [Dethiosulfatibacter aminovorans DSM 17477]
MLISPFSAIFSWEGYEYQAHISLYVALKKINELVNLDLRDTIDVMSLEIESADDFSIKIDNQYDTLHQVKRGAFSLKKNDKFAFIISLLQYNASKGYYHIQPKKNIPKDFVSVSLEQINSLISDLSKAVKDKNEVNESDYGNYIILSEIGRNKTKGSLYNILDYKCSEDKSKQSVIKVIDDIRKELNTYCEQLNPEGGELKDENLLCKYEISFNDSLEVKNASYEFIKNILQNERPEWTFVDEEYARVVYYQLYLELKRLIEKEYNDTGAKSGCQFIFSDIMSKLTKDYKSESNSIDYQYYLVFESIERMFKKYPERSKSSCEVASCEECDKSEECNLKLQIEKLSNLTDENRRNFLYKAMMYEPDTKKPQNLPSEQLVNRLIIEMLQDVDKLHFEENNLIQAFKDDMFYRLTLDSSGDIDDFHERLSSEITNDDSDKLLLFENDVLITDQLDEDNILFDGNKVTVIGAEELRELGGITSHSIEKIRKNYNKPKVMRLVGRGLAKEELNR